MLKIELNEYYRQKVVKLQFVAIPLRLFVFYISSRLIEDIIPITVLVSQFMAFTLILCLVTWFLHHKEKYPNYPWFIVTLYSFFSVSVTPISYHNAHGSSPGFLAVTVISIFYLLLQSYCMKILIVRK